MNRAICVLSLLLAMLLSGCVTPLENAASRGDVTEVRRLLGNGANVNAADSDGETVLMRAAAQGYAAVVQQLLDKGADVNAQTHYGYTALLFAAENGHTDCVSKLLDQGANIDAQGSASARATGF